MIQCPNCGFENLGSAKECEKCKYPFMSGKTEVIIHDTPKLPFIKRTPFRK